MKNTRDQKKQDGVHPRLAFFSALRSEPGEVIQTLIQRDKKRHRKELFCLFVESMFGAYLLLTATKLTALHEFQANFEFFITRGAVSDTFTHGALKFDEIILRHNT